MKGDEIGKYPEEYCDICVVNEIMELNWWWREASLLGGRGEWVCGICHPKPVRRGSSECSESS